MWKEDRKQPGKELDGDVEAEVNQMRQIGVDPSDSCPWLETNVRLIVRFWFLSHPDHIPEGWILIIYLSQASVGEVKVVFTVLPRSCSLNIQLSNKYASKIVNFAKLWQMTLSKDDCVASPVPHHLWQCDLSTLLPKDGDLYPLPWSWVVTTSTNRVGRCDA